MSQPARDRVPARLAVVVAGAAVLVVETLAARLVAPYVGLTLESYTAAIGVALLGIAMGAHIGGAVSDRLPPVRVLTGALAAGGVLVLLVRPIVLVLGPLMPRGAASAVLLVGGSTLPAVAVLSMVPPAAVKHRLRDLGHSGRVVGQLSALGTLGALAGTFVTGYVLVATLPTWAVLALTGGACLLLALIAGAATRVGRGGISVGTAAAVVAAAALAGVQSPCDVETAYYCAVVVTDSARPTGRVLQLDDVRHSYVNLSDPTHLEFGYIRRFAAVVDATFAAGRPLDAVHLGGGGFTMPRWLAATRPGTRSTVLELDPAVVELGRSRLGVDDIDNLRVVTGDARISLRSLPDDSADLIVCDAFGSLSVPWHLATRELLADVQRVLRPTGVVVLNVIDNGPKRFLAAEARTLDAVVASTALLARPDQLTPPGGGNFVLVGADAPLQLTPIEAAAAQVDGTTVTTGPAYAEIAAAGPLLTDDYAPVDQLLTPYRTE